MPNNFHFDWNSLISALIGGGLSLVGAVGAVLVQGHINRKEEKAKEQSLLQGFIQSIKTEVKTLWDGYANGVGKEIEAVKAGEPFLSTYPITQDYFTVYTNSSFLIGKLENEKLREKIVETYSTARTLINAYRLNNELIREKNQLEYTKVSTGSYNLSGHIKMKEDELRRYVPKILNVHNELKNEVKELLDLIDKEYSA